MNNLKKIRNLKKIKNKQKVQKLKNSFKYIYICRYQDLDCNNILNLQLLLNKNNYKFKFIKQNFFNKSFKGQGSILIIFFNKFSDLKNLNLLLNSITNLNSICILNANLQYSFFKINTLLNNSNIYFNLNYYFYNIYNIFLRIQANIT